MSDENASLLDFRHVVSDFGRENMFYMQTFQHQFVPLAIHKGLLESKRSRAGKT